MQLNLFQQVKYTESHLQRVRLQRANNLVPTQHPMIDNNVKMLCYKEPPVTASTFSCIKVLVVSGTQCTFMS